MDLIERRDVLGLPRNITKNFSGEVIEETINVEDIKALPSKQPQRMRGRWQVYQLAERGEAWTVQCSVCHSIGFHGKTPYCPECGAQMEGQEEQDDT